MIDVVSLNLELRHYISLFFILLYYMLILTKVACSLLTLLSYRDILLSLFQWWWRRMEVTAICQWLTGLCCRYVTNSH